jgi:hypothetical protein
MICIPEEIFKDVIKWYPNEKLQEYAAQSTSNEIKRLIQEELDSRK